MQEQKYPQLSNELMDMERVDNLIKEIKESTEKESVIQLVSDEDVLTDKATVEDLLRATGDPNNMMVALHKPGSTVKKTKSGDTYIVDANGTWRKVI